MQASVRTVAVVGASRDAAKFGNISVRAHRQCGYDVYPVNPHADEVAGVKAVPSLSAVPVGQLDRVTIYLPPEQVLEVLAEISALPLPPREVWLNPGSSSARVRSRADELGIPVIEGCSIVDLGISPYEVR